MPTSTPRVHKSKTQEDDRFVDVQIYGLNRPHAVRRLLKALAPIPCLPQAIFRIDRYGRELVAADLYQRTLYYIRVRHWGSEKAPARIEWTLDPESFGRKLRSRAQRAADDYTLGVRPKPRIVRLDWRKHVEEGARTPAVAS